MSDAGDLWLEVWRGGWKKLIGLKMNPVGDVQVGMVQEISSTGYSVKEEQMSDVKKLMDICRDVCARYPPKIDAQGNVLETYCNWGLRDVALMMGCPDLHDKTANQILAFAIANPAKYVRDTPRRATQHALKGGFAFAAAAEASGHGHVATVLPLPLSYSASLKKDVPMLANVGHHNGFLPQSMCFLISHDEPLYFLWGEPA